MMRRAVLYVLFFAPLLLFGSGCAPRRPAVVPVQGIVLLNNEPLANAAVEFVPMLDGYGSEMNSTAFTDEQGRFTLKCNWHEQTGAVLAKHKVVVIESPAPGALEERERGSRNRSTVVLPTLPNRPIPAKYGTVGSTPLEIEVKAG